MQNDQVITKLLLFGNEKLKVAQNKSILTSTIEFLQATERFKTSLFNQIPNGMVLLTHYQFYSVYIYCVTCCNCFSQLSLLVLLYFLYFLVLLLLLEYVKLDKRFCYQVLVDF